MSDDCISRQAVLALQYRIDDSATLSTRDVVNVEDIEELPPVTPQPKTGHWIVHEIESTLKWLECSNCHCETSYNVMHNYCPNCGACMKDCRTLDEFIEDSKESEEV